MGLHKPLIRRGRFIHIWVLYLPTHDALGFSSWEDALAAALNYCKRAA